MKKNSVFAAFSMITQFGLCVIVPMLLCIGGSVWLKNRCNLGDWVVLIGLLMGIGSGIMSMLKTIKQMNELTKEDDADV